MLSSRSSSNRKPFSDLTNKLSATSLDDKNEREATKSKVTLIKSLISEEPKKKDHVDDVDEVETVDTVETVEIQEVSASNVSVEEEKHGGAKPKVKRRPANLTNLGVSSLENFPLETVAAMVPPPPPSPLIPGSFFYLGAPSNTGFLQMTPLAFPFPAPLSGSQGQDTVAYVEEPGYISLKMSHGIVLDISNDFSVRLLNPRQRSGLAMCGEGNFPQVSVMHPLGRAIVYENRAEVQMEDEVSVKNAKLYPRGISFTANNLALVYQLDMAGARTTSDTFHDLHATNIVDTLFLQRCDGLQTSVRTSCDQLSRIRYWRTKNHVDTWAIGDILVRQTRDGYVMVWRKGQDGSKAFLSASPENGKCKVGTGFIQVTASRGEEAHFFLKSEERRIHYTGVTKVMMVRSYGHSAGFDEAGSLRIY